MKTSRSRIRPAVLTTLPALAALTALTALTCPPAVSTVHAAANSVYFAKQEWAPTPLPAASYDTVFGDELYINPAFRTRKVTATYKGMSWVTGMDAFLSIPVRLTGIEGRIACTFTDLSVFQGFFNAISAQIAAATSQTNLPLYDNGNGTYIYLTSESHLEVRPEAAQYLANLLSNMVLSGGCDDIAFELGDTLLSTVENDRQLSVSPDFVLAGECTTSFRTSGSNRSNNIRVGAARMNNLVVMPGQTVSVSDTILPRTSANGYKPAGVYLNGVHTTGMGGGVCQISSTVYNAVMNAGMTVVERKPHSMPVSYLPKGLDAAIAAGSKDMKFRNDYAAPVILLTNTDNKRLTVQVLALQSELGGRTHKLWAAQTGSLTADTYLTTYQDGQETGTVLIGHSRYNPLVEEGDED